MRPCKFGLNCNKLATGTCTFNHDQQSMQNSNKEIYKKTFNPGSKMGGGYQGYQGNPGNKGNHENNNNYQGQYNYGTHQGSFGNNFPNNKPNNPSNKPNNFPKSDDFQSQFCRNFHFGQPCKFGDKCSRKHGFDLQDKIKRVQQMRNVPDDDQSKLGSFQRQGKKYFILRSGYQIHFLQFDAENSNFLPLGKWQLPNKNIKYDWYSQKNNFIYFSSQNPKSSFFDLGIYDILTTNLVTIQSAHQKRITGAVHIGPSLVFTTSEDGYAKIWKTQGQKAVLDKIASQTLFKCYSKGPLTNLNFVDVSQINGLKITSVGTSDNRLLFFIGDNMQFHQVILEQNHANVFQIRYLTYNQTPYALILVWSKEKTSSAILTIDLNQFSQNVLLNVNATQNPKNNLYLFEYINNMLFVSNVFGNITIYKLSPAFQKIGVILNQNSINSIVNAEYYTSTNIKINTLFVLQNKFNQKPGSLGVYILKN